MWSTCKGVSHLVECFLHGIGSLDAGLVHRQCAQSRIEWFGLDRAVVSDLKQGVEKLFHGDDSGGGGQLAAVVTVLIECKAGGSVVQVDGNHILSAQRQNVLLRFLRIEPMPAVELDAEIIGANS